MSDDNNTTNESDLDNNNNNNNNNSIDNNVRHAMSDYKNPRNDSTLHEAIWKRNLTEIRKIIEQQPNTIQHQNKWGEYPLHLACQYFNNDEYNAIFVTLLEMNPTALEKKDSRGNFPLHIALKYVQSEYVTMLLLSAYPLAVECMNSDEKYPLHIACECIFSETIVLKLIEMYPTAAEHKDCSGSYPLHIACGRSSISSETIILKLIDMYPTAAEHKDCRGFYPLHIACGRSSIFSETIISKLIDMYPTAAEDKDCLGLGSYLLHIICGRKGFSVKVAMKLLDVYPDAGKCFTSSRESPLDLACGNCNKQSEKLLLRLINTFPEAINLKNYAGCYPLQSACGNSQNLSMKVLLRLFPVNVVQDHDGDTPLSCLFVDARIRLIPELPICQFHMEQNWKKLLSSALQLIDAYPNQAMCKHEYKQRYPLHLACKQGIDERIILCLIHINLLAVKQKCYEGKYPLDYAKQSNLTSVAHVLEDLMNKDNDELENRVGIPSVVTSYDINNIYRCSIMEWVQCNTPSYIEGKYIQAVPVSKPCPSYPSIDNVDYRTRKRERDNDVCTCME